MLAIHVPNGVPIGYLKGEDAMLTQEQQEKMVSELANADTIHSPTSKKDLALWEILVANPKWRHRQKFVGGFGISLQAYSEAEKTWVHIRWL